ncbi:hypothetical protein CARUB_v10024572mg, partial [Capsella rubella]
GRVNAYSKPQYLVDILEILDGTPELEIILKSQFGSLFLLPVRRCLLSGRLVHNFLCRQIVTTNPTELWFTYGGWPLRFSMVEFEMVTWLFCGPYPEKGDDVSANSSGDREPSYLYTLVGEGKNLTIDDIVTILKAELGIPGWRKIRLVLLVIVEGILICGTQPIRPSYRVVEMLSNVDLFLAYPWGRKSFERTLRMINVGSVIHHQAALVEKLKQHSLVILGFPIGIQLFLFQSIPLLLRYLPCARDGQTFLDRKIAVFPQLKTYHTYNILELEYDKGLCVQGCVGGPSKKSCSPMSGGCDGDPKVHYLLTLMTGGYLFSKSYWVGGDDSCSKLCLCMKKKQRPCRCGTGEVHEDGGLTAEASYPVSSDMYRIEIEKLRMEIHRLKQSTDEKLGKLSATVVSDVMSLLQWKNSDVGSTKCEGLEGALAQACQTNSVGDEVRSRGIGVGERSSVHFCCKVWPA